MADETQGELSAPGHDPALLMATFESYADGATSWDEVRQLVQSWDWAPRAPRAEEWGDAQLDPPGSFADVEQAYTDNLISSDEYKELYGLSRTHVSS